MKKIAALLALVICWPSIALAQSFTDMFTGSGVNPSYWQVFLPFSDSSVIENGGSLVLSNAGRILSVNSFPSGVDITLKFAFTGSAHDVFQVYTRTNGATTNGVFSIGISFHVQIQTDTGDTSNNIIIAGPNGVLVTATYPITLGQNYTLRVVDDGVNLSFFVNNTVTPLLTAVDTDILYQNIGLQNREGAESGSTISAGSQVTLGAITVNSLPVVAMAPPESHLINLSTLGSSGFSMGFVISGNAPKTVLVRGVGPTLSTFGVPNVATQTSLTLFSGSIAIGSNSGWSTAPNASEMQGAGGSFPLTAGSGDSAILTTLNPGAYSAQVTGNGVVLLEVYDTQ